MGALSRIYAMLGIAGTAPGLPTLGHSDAGKHLCGPFGHKVCPTSRPSHGRKRFGPGTAKSYNDRPGNGCKPYREV